MNRQQRQWIIAIALAFALACLVVPWRYGDGDWSGYDWLWERPRGQQRTMLNDRQLPPGYIDFTVLCLEWGAISSLGFAFILGSGDAKDAKK